MAAQAGGIRRFDRRRAQELISRISTHFVLHVLLVDDEASARADLRAKLAAHRDVIIVGEAPTISAARALLARADYDLVFLDIQLIGGESFELLPLVRAGASLVFATAHDRYAARAFETQAVDYLLKPIDSTRLAEALRRAKAVHTGILSRLPVAVPDQAAPSGPPSASLAPTPVHGLPAFPASSSEVGLTDNERVFLRQCLEAWEDALPVTNVLRAQRGQTARLPRAVRYEREVDATRLFLADAPVSRARRWWRALRTRLSK